MRTNLLFEDSEDHLDWIDFFFIFEAKNEYLLNKCIQTFEKSHPFLTLVSVECLDKWISVLGEPLFTDEKQLYRELFYRFKRYKQIRYYQQDKPLLEWLNSINELETNKITNRLLEIIKLLKI